MTALAPIIDLQSRLPLATDQIQYNARRDPLGDDALAVLRGEMVRDQTVEATQPKLVIDNPEPVMVAGDITIPRAQFEAIVKAVDVLKAQLEDLRRKRCHRNITISRNTRFDADADPRSLMRKKMSCFRTGPANIPDRSRRPHPSPRCPVISPVGGGDALVPGSFRRHFKGPRNPVARRDRGLWRAGAPSPAPAQRYTPGQGPGAAPMTDEDDMRRLGYPPTEDETVTVNKYALTAIIRGALSRAFNDSASVEQFGATPANTKGRLKVADEEPPTDILSEDPGGEALVWGKIEALCDTLALRLDGIAKQLNEEDCP